MLVSVEQKREMKRTVRLIRWVHIEVVLAFIGKRCTIPIDGVGLGLSTLLGHLHQLLPAANATSFRSRNNRNRWRRVFLPTSLSPFCRCSDSTRPCIFYSCISVPKSSATTEYTTVASTGRGASSSASVDTSAHARKQGEQLQPTK